MSVSPQPDVRIYLFTYRRNDLLQRALKSLLDQTHQNWVCELHNDDPNDSFPEELIEVTNDARITYFRHARNLGAVGSFNLAFSPICESYISILEDDNWWEPDFLETMLAAIEEHPEVSVAWANMWFSREMADGSWQRSGSIWPATTGSEVKLIFTPDPRQVCGFLHSHGAMLARNTKAVMFTVPLSLPVFAIEAVRERAYPGPLLLIQRPLANFAITRTSARGETADQNMQVLVLLARSFLENFNVTHPFLQRVWHQCRGSLGHKHRALIVAGIQSGQLGQMFHASSWIDLVLVVAWALRHPRRFRRLFHAAKSFPEVADFLDDASRRRSHEWNLTPALINPESDHDSAE